MIDEILENLGIKYKKSNDERIFSCPFHNEKTASCFLNIRTGQFHCFGCDTAGSIRTFLTKLNVSNVEIDNVVKNIDFKPIQRKKLDSVKLVDTTLDDSILMHYHYKPQFLLDLGFDERLLWNMQIGYHPERHRLIYPIRDHLGHLVGVSGGSTIGYEPKYKVYRGGYSVNGFKVDADFGSWFDELYPHYKQIEKSNYIWNFDSVYKKALKENIDYVIITEGFKACLWLLQHGYTAVALMTKSLSNIQFELLQRIPTKYMLMLDNDLAGIKGTENAIYKMFRACNLYKINYNKNQPDDLNSEDLRKAIANAEKISSESFKKIAKEKQCTIQQKSPHSSLLHHNKENLRPKRNSLLNASGKNSYLKEM